MGAAACSRREGQGSVITLAPTAPDYAEPTVGWRVWDVVETGGTLRLSSLLYYTVWLPGQETVACCRRPLAAFPWGRMPLHGPPNYDCYCGIHAVEKEAHAVAYLDAPVFKAAKGACRVLGRVSLWGRVVECRWGWRAARAYPEHLFVPTPARRRLSFARAALHPSIPDIAPALAEYGVPVEIVARAEFRLSR